MDHQSNSSTLKTAIMASLASAESRDTESQPQRMQAKKRRSMFDYTSEMRDPVTIGTRNKTFSKNTTQENCENQNLQCMKDLPTSIDSVFAKANKSAVKLEEVTQTDKVQGVNSIDYSNLSFCFTLYLFVLLCHRRRGS